MPLPKKDSGPNPASFQFLTGGRLTQVVHSPPHLKTLATPMICGLDSGQIHYICPMGGAFQKKLVVQNDSLTGCSIYKI